MSSYVAPLYLYVLWNLQSYVESKGL
jgi:hypothetical protein